jgi:spermidine synthase
LNQRISRPEYAKVAQSLRDVGIASPIDLLATYAGDKNDLAPWIKGAHINQDKNLRLQYLAGWGINSQLANDLYLQIISYVKPPQHLIEGSPQTMQAFLGALSAEWSGSTQP